MFFQKLERWLHHLASQKPALYFDGKVGIIPFRWKIRLVKDVMLVSEVSVPHEVPTKKIAAFFDGTFVPEEHLVVGEHIYSRGTRLGVIYGHAIESHHHFVILQEKFAKILWLRPEGIVAKGDALAEIVILDE